jgi:hypothetical protein
VVLVPVIGTGMQRLSGQSDNPDLFISSIRPDTGIDLPDIRPDTEKMDILKVIRLV